MEESFNLQASHDFLIHTPLHLPAFDHNDFDGGGGGQVVSRSFLGAALLASASLPSLAAVRLLRLPKIFLQLGVRLTLAFAVCAALCAFARAAARRSGRNAGLGLLLCAAASPHYMFYASRTLPNTFATILVALCAAHWAGLPLALPAPPRQAALQRQLWGALCGWAPPSGGLCKAVGCLMVALAWFRCDMLVLLVPVGAGWLLAGRATLPQLVALGVAVGGGAVAVSVAFDSVMWGRVLWPEAEVLYKNVVLGVMNNYEDAKEPWHYYFTKALPYGFLGSLPLVLVGLFKWPSKPRSLFHAISSIRFDEAVCELALPALAFIVLYSKPANKQDRFIIPAYPLLFYAAGVGGERILLLAGWLMGRGEGGGGELAAIVKKKAAPPAPPPRARSTSGLRARRASAAAAPPPPPPPPPPHQPAAPLYAI